MTMRKCTSIVKIWGLSLPSPRKTERQKSFVCLNLVCLDPAWLDPVCLSLCLSVSLSPTVSNSLCLSVCLLVSACLPSLYTKTVCQSYMCKRNRTENQKQCARALCVDRTQQKNHNSVHRTDCIFKIWIWTNTLTKHCLCLQNLQFEPHVPPNPPRPQ